ncbi:MAG: hypothetical protein CW338_06150 [Clostridiales bacterium]|nr:hypothetical protein [Clostridiales bacterium]
MKRIFCFLLLIFSVLSLLFSAGSLAEAPAMFTGSELDIYAGEILSALPDDLQPLEEDGILLYDTGIAGIIFKQGEAPSAAAAVDEIRVTGGLDPRGLSGGCSAEDVLAAYPNDNPALTGTAETALLYMEDNARRGNGNIRCGWIGRSAEDISSISYADFEVNGNSVLCRQISYYLKDSFVISVCMYYTRFTRSEMTSVLNELAGSLENADFTPWPIRENGLELAAFRREDLSFSGMDLMDLTPELSGMIFGRPLSDAWLENDDAGFLRICEWAGIRAVFAYDSGKRFTSVRSLTLTGTDTAGPRGVRCGDSLYSVQHRFRFENETGTLYGEPPRVPYAEKARADDTTLLRYATEAEGKTVILNIEFAGGTVCGILLSVQ